MLIVLISCDIMDNLLRIFFAQLDDSMIQFSCLQHPPTEMYDIKVKWNMTDFRSCLPHTIPDQAWQDFFWPMMIWMGN